MNISKVESVYVCVGGVICRCAFMCVHGQMKASLVAQMVKNLPANAGDTKGVGSIHGSRRSPEEEMATHSSILAWKIPRTEKPAKSQMQLSNHN